MGFVLYSANKPTPYVAPDGFSAFALFYVVAQAIERLIEPFTSMVTASPATDADGEDKKKVSKPEAETKRNEHLALAFAGPDMDTAQKGATKAALWQSVVDAISKRTKILAWGAATGIGALAAGALGLMLLAAIGAKVDPAIDIVVTGLVIGGGSKGLHDVITKVQKSKDKDDKPEGVS